MRPGASSACCRSPTPAGAVGAGADRAGRRRRSPARPDRPGAAPPGARREKRLVVLRHIATLFEPGVRYPAKDVNVVLRAFHHDFAALRRYLVDECLLSRAGDLYWRSGGPVEV
nr:DUF2087 domain-containing protein [Spongiactinospora gelatinilytica]